EFEYEYDEFLITGLKKQILESKKNKILIVLHTYTNHGPSYYKKYPPRFNKFTPVCTSVELTKCNQEELINAYDNTVVYVDYMLATIIEKLKELKEYKRAMIYISDHGESLGEKNLYMHGLPKSIAPSEQYKIPFIVWSSDNSKKPKNNETASQHHIFHSVLDFLDVESPVYDEEMSVFE
nr:sulfatase-like hydrolase/transferase [Flavobacteriaceae bacterium]